MIDGLKLTFGADELHRLLHERAERHRSEIERLKTDQAPERQDSVDCCILPEHMVDGMIERHEWRSEILDFISAHVDAAETYRLGVEDLDFAELLPETPAGRERHRGPVIANGPHELADDGMLDAMVVDDVSGAGGRRRFTADEYQRMGQVGILSDDERVELIEGEILTMSPIYSPHAAAVDRANRVMNMTSGAQAIVRVQGPIRLNLCSEPQPDIVLLRPRDDFYASAHPGPEDVLLVIEIADSSLRYDRDVKAPLYAREGIVEYWLVDLNDQSVTGYTEVSDGVYGRSVTWRRGQSLAPAQLPGVILRVDDLLT